MNKVIGENLRANDEQSWFNTVWDALDLVADKVTQEEWDDIATAMAWIGETLEVDIQP
jgi:aromatic ring-cleaving dioxygenase